MIRFNLRTRLAVFFSLLFIFPLMALGDNTTGFNTAGFNTASGNQSGSAPETVSLSNPLGTSDVPTLIGNIIKAVLSVIGSLALVMFIYGGFTWMLAGGSSEKVKKGRDIIVWAAIGLIVVFSSYALVRFVITSIANTGGG